jgi:dTDP-4-dehydrorhamnose reductase
MKIFIFGAKGMLGRYVSSIMKGVCQIISLTRDDFDLIRIQELNNFLDRLRILPEDVFINCAVVMKERITQKGMTETIIVNSLLPHLLAGYCNEKKARLIHISSDCVFNGKKGNYLENDAHDGMTPDGKTKSLGEPEFATILRTSIIGEEFGQKRHLLEWIRSQKGEICGYTDHIWNGVTCLHLAQLIKIIIIKNLFWNGARHIFSPNKVSKYQLLCFIKKIYRLEHIKIKEIKAGFCDRAMSSLFKQDFLLPDLESQIRELKDYNFS